MVCDFLPANLDFDYLNEVNFQFFFYFCQKLSTQVRESLLAVLELPYQLLADYSRLLCFSSDASISSSLRSSS